MGRGCTHKKISDYYYQTFYPNTRGYSERIIWRFCRTYNIRRISDVQIDNFENFISLYGHRYVRSMTQGSIRYTLAISSGIVSQRRIARSLKRLAPFAYKAWARDTFDRTNPIPYFAPYFGYKGHMDQNEKLLRNTVARIWLWQMVALEWYVSMLLEVKNPILIYEYVFRPAILKFGL